MRNTSVKLKDRMKDDYYDEFVDKFKPKLTTDDCYTPEIVYNAIRDWAINEYGIGAETRIMRPFYPGGDFVNEDYSGDCVVIDNPPFSILSRICRWYVDHGVKFFLFAPSLTLFSTLSGELNYVICSGDITYENGARVKTSFVTNLGEYKINVSPELHDIIEEKNDENQKALKEPELPVYDYPNELCTAAILNHLSVHGTSLKIKADDVHFVRRIDAQKAKGKAIFGSGFLMSERAAAERAAAERAAAERAAAERAAAERAAQERAAALKRRANIFELSEREWEIIRNLGQPREVQQQTRMDV